MANTLRRLDRHRNMDRYPIIDYDEIYVLEKGYHSFFIDEDLREYCYPREYIKMKSKQYSTELRKYHFHRKTSCQGFGIRTQSMNQLITRSATSSPDSSLKIKEDVFNNDFISKCLLSSPPTRIDTSVVPRTLSLDESPLMN